MTPEDRLQLSPAGRARKDAMRLELVASMDRLHQARRVRRQVIIVALPLCAAAILVTAMANRGSVPPAPGPPGPPGLAAQGTVVVNSASGESDSSTPIVYVATNPGILDLCRLEVTSRVDYIDDDDLLVTLRQIDRPAGLVVVGNKARLTAPVTDPMPPGPSGALTAPPGATAG